MCELFGLSGKTGTDITDKLREFFSHAPENPNGWGFFYENEGRRFFHKESLSAEKSRFVKELTAGRVLAENAVGHIRLATIGHASTDNSHPFEAVDESGRRWIFAHNGTIFEGDTLDAYFHIQKGETDSERIFLYFLDLINERIRRNNEPLDEEERFEILQTAIAELAPQNKLNLLIFDGEILYAHTNYKDSLYEMTEGANTFISTRPLSGGDWKNLPFTRLVSYKDGRRIRIGEDHGHEYIPDEASINAIMLAYSEL